jgi:hypothetical protein
MASKASSSALSTAPVTIAVLDRGWVFVGRLTRNDDGIKLENAACIRRWGTTKGVGELALHGPQSSTSLDEAGTVIVPASSVICLIETTEDLWKGR